MNPDPDRRRFIQRQLAVQGKYGLRSNALLQLAGHQRPRVNNKELKLSGHASTLLFLLAGWAQEFPGDFFPTAGIVRALERRSRVLGELGLSWKKPTQAKVHSAASNLRKALDKQRVADDILECIPNVGYRLAIPAMNIDSDPSAQEILERLVLGSFRGSDGNGSEGPRHSS